MPDSGAIGVLADDLIWASRLIEAVRRAGADPLRLGGSAELERALAAGSALATGSASTTGSAAPTGSGLAAGSAETKGGAAPTGGSVALRGVIVDLLGRRYDGIAAVERVHRAGLPVIAVAEHDDLVTRKGALAAGAWRVFSYNKFSTDGARLVATWLSADGGEP